MQQWLNHDMKTASPIVATDGVRITSNHGRANNVPPTEERCFHRGCAYVTVIIRHNDLNETEIKMSFI